MSPPKNAAARSTSHGRKVSATHVRPARPSPLKTRNSSSTNIHKSGAGWSKSVGKGTESSVDPDDDEMAVLPHFWSVRTHEKARGSTENQTVPCAKSRSSHQFTRYCTVQKGTPFRSVPPASKLTTIVAVVGRMATSLSLPHMENHSHLLNPFDERLHTLNTPHTPTYYQCDHLLWPALPR